MIVDFYNFNKRPNSTKQPAVNDSTLVELTTVQLKENTSFLNPVLLIPPNITVNNVSVQFNPVMFNYVYIPAWSRYYYVRDWVYLNSVWECSLVPDPLASFKTSIGQTSAYVLRSYSQFNTDVTDSFYPATSNMMVSRQNVESEIERTTIPSGCFVLGIINNDSSVNTHVGSVCYYALDMTNMKTLMTYLFSDSIYIASGIDEIGDGLFKSMFDPFQYIVSCMWFPFANTVPAGSNPSLANLKVGYWDITGAKGYPVRQIVKEFGFHSQSEIGHHPQQATRGNYLDKAPYTKLTLYYPPFGEIPIDTQYMRFYGSGESNWLYGKIYLDFITGNADLRMSITNGYDIETTADPYYTMCQRSSRIGVPIQISKVMTDYINMAQSTVGAVSSLFSGNIAGIFSNVISGVSNSFPKVGSIGSNGSFLEIIEQPYLIKEYYLLVSEDRTEFGRPLCQQKTLSTLSGYIQCGEGDHAFPCTYEEKRIINDALKNGFFME